MLYKNVPACAMQDNPIDQTTFGKNWPNNRTIYLYIQRPYTTHKTKWKKYRRNNTHLRGYLPFKTCTVTLLLFALDGLHWYCPESDGLAFLISRNDVVVSSFFVITDTPPRGDSYVIIWKKDKKKKKNQ